MTSHYLQQNTQNQNQMQNQNQNQQGQYSQFGAHEVMEVHEVLTNGINSINTGELMVRFVRDTQLQSMLTRQVQFMVQEYNNLVQAVNSRTFNQQQSIPYRTQSRNMTQAPQYGLNNPSPMSPNASINEMDDRDVSSIMLGLHKTGAGRKMMAALECADPQLRRMMQQGAVNCSELAYETWQYMNSKGYYQIPTLKQTTTQTFMNTFNPATTNITMDTTQATQGIRQYQ
jgi:spore coat protein CotF